MPRPATLTDAIGLVRRSGLLDDGAVKGFVATTRRKGFRGLTPDGLLIRMAEDGLLTPFQAGQLAEGRWRGLVLGDYLLKARLGRGGMGQVFLGEHRQHRRPVAVKVLNASLAGDPIAKARLMREARATSALDHPNIVKVFGADGDHAPPYLVMEYVDGLSLQAIVALSGTLPIEATVLCARQIALGLAHATEAGLVHRDIKPANLLLDRFGVVKILDLGIVLEHGDAALTIRPDGRSPMLGTVDYLAPEQALDSHAVDCRADIYALGGTLYFLLAGHPPFADGDAHLRLRRKQTADPAPIHRLRPDVPPELSAAISRMLARDPADRFQTPWEVAETLTPWAVPVAGFPEDLFARIGSGDSSGELRFRPENTGSGRFAPSDRRRSPAPGGDPHSALSATMAGLPAFPDDPAQRSTVTPPPQTLQTRSSRSLSIGPPPRAVPMIRLRTATFPSRRGAPRRLAVAIATAILIAVAVLIWLAGTSSDPPAGQGGRRRGVTADGVCDHRAGDREVRPSGNYP